MPSPAKNAATSGGSGAAALKTDAGLAEAEQAADRPEHLLVGRPELGRQLRWRGLPVLAALHVAAAGVHGLGHGGPLALVLLGGQQGLDAGPDLLPHPGHAEERGRAHLARSPAPAARRQGRSGRGRRRRMGR